MSDLELENDTINQRALRVATPLVIVNGRLNFPPGTIINAFLSNLILDPNFLDIIPNANIVQGRTLANPNTVPTDGSATRSLMVSSGSSTLSGLIYNTILSSLSSTITGALTQRTGIYDTTSCNITSDSTALGNLWRSGIIDSISSNLTLQALSSGNLDGCTILSANNGLITVLPTALAGASYCLIGASNNATITANGTGITAQSSLIDAETCSITNNGTGAFRCNTMVGADTCTLVNYASMRHCGIANCGSSNITQGNPSTATTFDSGIFCCNSCNITQGISSVGGIFGGIIAGSTLCTISSPDNTLGGGMNNVGIFTSRNGLVTTGATTGLLSYSSLMNTLSCTIRGSAAGPGIQNFCLGINSSSTSTLNNLATAAGATFGNQGIFACDTCNINPAGTATLSMNANLLGGCISCNITPQAEQVSASGMLCSTSSNIVGTVGFTGAIQENAVIATFAGTINKNVNGIHRGNIIGSSTTCTITSGNRDIICSCSTCTIVAAGQCNIFGGISSNVQNLNPTVGTITQSGLWNVSTCNITMPVAGPGTINACGMVNASGCTLTTGATAGLLLSSGIFNSNTCQIIGECPGPSNLNFNLGIHESTVCVIDNRATATSGPCKQAAIIASNTCNIQPDTTTTAATDSNDILGSILCNLTPASSGVFQENGILHSESCNINQAAAFTGDMRQCSIISALSSTIDKNANANARGNVILGATTSSITSGNRTVIAGATSGVASGTTNCLLAGTSPSVTGFTNVLAMGATATASSQTILGTRLDVTGGNSTVTAGYMTASNGTARNAINSAINVTLLTSHDSIHFASTADKLLTLPTAASFAASFPANSMRCFRVSCDPSATGCHITTAGGDTFKNKTGWTTQYIPREGTQFELIWTNPGGTPYWTFGNKIDLRADADMTTANNFGTSPPKADASLLPTSTSKANHQSLTTTAYVTFDTLTTDSSQIFTQSGAVITLPVTGYYRMRYGFNVKQTAAVPALTAYQLRMDVNNITAAASVGNSYVEIGGMNDLSGTRYIEVDTDQFFLNASTQIAVRISQDSVNTIPSTASVIFSKLIIFASI